VDCVQRRPFISMLVQESAKYRQQHSKTWRLLVAWSFTTIPLSPLMSSTLLVRGLLISLVILFRKWMNPCRHTLYCYYHDCHAKDWNQLLPYFPRNLITMKSGCGFQKSRKERYTKAFMRKSLPQNSGSDGTLKCTKKEIEDLFPPQHWEFVSNSLGTIGCMAKLFDLTCGLH
jgi:hypothetical protein